MATALKKSTSDAASESNATKSATSKSSKSTTAKAKPTVVKSTASDVKSTGVKSAGVKSTSTKPAAAKSTASKPKDAISLLRADHKLVSDLFEEFEKTRSASKKKALVKQICTELTVHAQVEEEIFYPAAKKALKDKELIPEATVEHATLKDLIAQVEDVEPDGEMYDAKVKVMSEYVKHHVKEEQNELFPKVKATSLDLVELGAQLSGRKEELLSARV